MRFKIEWIDRGREPKEQPDPKYPNGIDLDATQPWQKGCTVSLPYPAARCGMYIIKCSHCGYTAACTTAGRPDDPRSIRLPCKLN